MKQTKQKIAFIGKEIQRRKVSLDKDKIIKYLKKRKIITSVPVVVKLKTKNGDLKRFNARKCGVYVVKWSDVLKALRLK